MSGGRPFDRERFEALVDVLVERCPHLDASAVATATMLVDFECWAHTRTGMTGATYFKGHRHPEVRELGYGWFERRVTPWWGKLLGWAIATRMALR